jgi:AcrR family transcriptional regulator
MSTPDPLDVAADLLRQHGAADRILAVTVRTAADLAGVSRATIYRQWETAEALGTDLVVHLASEAEGWWSAVVACDPAEPVEASVERALAGAENDLGLLARTTVAAWPVGTPGRTEVVAAEHALLARFARWLDRVVAAAGRRWAPWASAELAALAATVLVDGAVIDGALRHPLGWVAAAPPRHRPTAASVGRLIDDLTVPGAEHGERPDPGPDGDDAGSRSDHSEPRTAILRAIAASAAGRAPWEAGLASGGRLVDGRRLARAVGVSERRLNRVWPTASAFDADLLEHLLARQRRQRERAGADVLARGIRLESTALEDLTIARLQQAAVDPWGCGGSPYDPIGAALADPVVRARLVAARDAWRHADRISTMALVSVVGWRLRDEVLPLTFTDTMFDSLLAATRWAALHPDLAARTAEYQGREVPVFGLAGWLVARAHAAP